MCRRGNDVPTQKNSDLKKNTSATQHNNVPVNEQQYGHRVEIFIIHK